MIGEVRVGVLSTDGAAICTAVDAFGRGELRSRWIELFYRAGWGAYKTMRNAVRVEKGSGAPPGVVDAHGRARQRIWRIKGRDCAVRCTQKAVILAIAVIPDTGDVTLTVNADSSRVG